MSAARLIEAAEAAIGVLQATGAQSEANALRDGGAEPVAWRFKFPTSDRWHLTPYGPHEHSRPGLTWQPLYATPPTQDAQWQPIETAPKDGRTVIVGRDMGGFGFVRGTGYFAGTPGAFCSGWISRGFTDPPGELGLAHPTHWMPLPAPPATPKEGSPT